MKSFFKISLLFCFLSLIVSCSNDVSEPSNKSVTDGMKYIGDINKIYESSSGRFATGQIIPDFFGHKVQFEGNLVEYNSIKKEVLDYVESLESNNALMHQGYDNVKYDPTKKYVEFSSYTDTTTNKIVAYEIRVFFGNFLETYKTDFWYAKSSMFNASFTKDIQKNARVNFGEPLIPEEEAETLGFNDFQVPQDQDDKINMELINAVGDAYKIYSAPNTNARFCTGQLVNWGNGTTRFQGNLVAYNSVNPKITSIFDKTPFNAMNHQ